MTRPEFNAAIRRLSVQDPGDQQYHCRVEICIRDDWRVLTDSCRFEGNIPLVLDALADMLWVFVIEHYPDVPAAECRKIGRPATEGVDKGMRVWPMSTESDPVKFLNEMESEFNRKTNNLIERHAQQITSLKNDLEMCYRWFRNMSNLGDANTKVDMQRVLEVKYPYLGEKDFT